MNYKELFEKYKNGIANEEEKRIVEEELEKYEAIEEYLSQIIDEKSVKAEDFDILEDNKEETSKLIKDVKKKVKESRFYFCNNCYCFFNCSFLWLARNY
mgnify:CR=1 FL=1